MRRRREANSIYYAPTTHQALLTRAMGFDSYSIPRRPAPRALGRGWEHPRLHSPPRRVRVQSQCQPCRNSDLCTVRCHLYLTSSMILLGEGVHFILHLVTISRGCRGSFQRLQTEPGFASTLPSPSARPACRRSRAGSGPRRKVFLQGVWEGKMLVPVSHHHSCPNLCPGGYETLLQQGLRDPQDHALAQLRLGSGAKSRRRV